VTVRIVQLLTQDVGGPADHAVDVAVGLVARGHDSHVVGPVSAGTPRARAAGVTWHPVSMASKRDAFGAVRVVSTLRSLRPDVVHLQDRRAGWLGRAVGGAHGFGGAGLVYTLHGVADGLSDLVPGNALAGPRRRRDRLYYLTGERAITRWGHGRVVVPSAAVARFAVQHVGLREDLVDVVPNGVDPVRFAPSTRPRVDGPPTVLWLGLLAHVKRVGLLLDAVEQVSDLRLLLAGDGPLMGEVERRVAGAALAGRVEVAGRVDDPATVVARADVFALSSAAENCPMALLQAMAGGLPVVSTAVGGVPEVVRDGVDGILCPVDDPDALARAFAILVGDPVVRTTMGRSARQRILDAYTIDHCVDGLLSSYEVARCAR
jgi:glycosyltransferase involved in cell wall biosynthesis